MNNIEDFNLCKFNKKKKKLLIQSRKLNVKIENKKTLVGCKQGHYYKEMKK